MFYEINIKIKTNVIDGFSYIYSQKNFLFTLKDNNGNEIEKAFICTCKNKDKNILLIKLSGRENPILKEIGNFDIYCFHPTLEKNTFLAGGYQENFGMIKSYTIDCAKSEIKEKVYKIIEGPPIEEILKIEKFWIIIFQNKRIVHNSQY